MHLFAGLCIALSLLERANCLCPSQCSCDYHGRNDGLRSRYASLLATQCSDDSEDGFVLKTVDSAQKSERRLNLDKL